MEVMQSIICNECNVAKTTISTRTGNFAKAIHWAGKNVVTRIMNYLYHDATVYLKRKHDKYLELIGISVE